MSDSRAVKTTLDQVHGISLASAGSQQRHPQTAEQSLGCGTDAHFPNYEALATRAGLGSVWKKHNKEIEKAIMAADRVRPAFQRPADLMVEPMFRHPFLKLKHVLDK